MYTILSRLMIFLCLAIIVIAAFFWYIPLIKQNESMYRSLLQLEESLMKENERGIKLDNERTLIKIDPYTVEKYVRECYLYSRPYETVFIFKTELPFHHSSSTPGTNK